MIQICYYLKNINYILLISIHRFNSVEVEKILFPVVENV
jgi:hypothetical protein